MLTERLAPLVHKRIRYNYRRTEFEFALTQALFSSAGVDSGTHQLLGLVAQTFADTKFETIIDVGSGTGVLGIAVAKSFDAHLHASDRDALATEWSRWNALENGVEHGDFSTDLAPPAPAGSERTLVVSNIPAKVGASVLDYLLEGIASRVQGSDSYAAVVVVAPLADWLVSTCERIGLTTVERRSSANHLSLILSRGPDARPDPSIPGARIPSVPDTFIRCQGCPFIGPGDAYAADTVYGLPEFDGLTYRTALAFDLLRSVHIAGTVLVRGVGQGHLAVGTAQRSRTIEELVLSDRDVLALRTAEHNVLALEGELPALSYCNSALAADHREDDRMYDWLVIAEEPVGGAHWISDLLDLARTRLVVGGKLLLVSSSTTVGRFEKAAGRHFRCGSERRMHGARAELFTRKR